jgi:hypothetical protein
LFVASIDNSRGFPAEIFKWSVQDGPARVEHNCPVLVETRELSTSGFAHATADPIAHHGFAYGTGQREADSGGLIGRGGHPKAKRGKVSAGHASSRLINFAKFGRPEKTICLWQRQRLANSKEKTTLRSAHCARH